MRAWLRKLIPFPVRVGLRRWGRAVKNRFDRRTFSRNKISDFSLYGVELSRRESRVIKKVPDDMKHLQENKRQSLNIACTKIDGVIVRPNEYFSFWRAVGKPNRRNGFTAGLEVREDELVESVGGGVCQLSNALCWCALNAGVAIIERHRHGLDLFPDDRRDVPFGSGATVLYNFKDFIFFNPLSFPLLIRAEVEEENLVVRFLSQEKPDFTVEMFEREHGFRREDGAVYRRNQIWRKITFVDGNQAEELVFENSARVMYEWHEQ